RSGTSSRPRLLPDRTWLRSRDEGFVQRARQIGGRAGVLVDRHEHDVAGRLEGWRIGAIADPGLEDVDPDRQRRFGAGHALAEWLFLVVADPHAERDVRIEADEPGVAEVVGRGRLAGGR